MVPFRAAVLAAFVSASVGGAFAAAPPPGAAAADGPRASRVAVVPAAENPDRDDAGVFIWDAWAACDVVPVFSREVVPHGAPTGDPEKDSLGFGVAGHDGCGGETAR